MDEPIKIPSPIIDLVCHDCGAEDRLRLVSYNDLRLVAPKGWVTLIASHGDGVEERRYFCSEAHLRTYLVAESMRAVHGPTGKAD